MTRLILFALLGAALPILACAALAQGPSRGDWRLITQGLPIPSGGRYADQPYIVRTLSGGWVCAVTTAEGGEGSDTQTIMVTRSGDQGKSWSDPQPLEPPEGPEASYSVLQVTPAGRIYCFYNYNRDNVREVKREDAGVYKRVDSLGAYVFRFSDDEGRTWSPKRYEIPIRPFRVDRENVYQGAIRFFWNVGRPVVHEGALLIPHHKVAAMGAGFFAQSEGAILRSPNLLTERDPDRITWETLPDGEIGLRTPAGGGRVAEEQSLAVLSDGSLICIYRSIDGHPVHSYSRDGGRTWSDPAYLTYSPGGRLVKHPRAANFIWQTAPGRFLYWFHNHGGTRVRRRPGWEPYSDRNPAWLCAAREVERGGEKFLEFSEPEIVLYDDDPMVRTSYPDLVREGDDYYLSETQKHVARLHRLEPAWLARLMNQWSLKEAARAGVVLERRESKPGDEFPAPALPRFWVRDNSRPDHAGAATRQGFSIELALTPVSAAPGQVLLDGVTPGGRGVRLVSAEGGAVEIVLSDGRQISSWRSDRDTLRPGRPVHLVATVDGGPRVITFVVDGVLCDGGSERQFGWGRFSPYLQECGGAARWRLAPGFQGAAGLLRVYNRALSTSEAAGNYRAYGGGAAPRVP